MCALTRVGRNAMIEIKNLTKIYNSKKKNKCVALNGINLTVQNNGLVFILGKSGSGKSTLLNLIGGLDNITSGSITVNGNDISTFKEKDFCNYRNSHVGFIFQDYHLIEELSVYENILLSLNLMREEDNGRVAEALKKVDLSGYENRYPNELSGGERQRVAIARTIVKNPGLILADEPTGNLDNVTATSIISLLKRLSNECLILIVSHNTADAYMYGDRIIELASGKIVSDITRNEHFTDELLISNNTLYFPYNRRLTEDDVESINQSLKNNSISNVVRTTDRYVPTQEVSDRKQKAEIKKARLSIKNTAILSLKFLKTKVGKILLSSLIASAIIVILALAMTIVTFDSGRVVCNSLTSMDSQDVVMLKGVDAASSSLYDKNYVIEVEDEDIQAFYDAGYTGNVYKLYTNSLHIRNNLLSYAKRNTYMTNVDEYATCLMGVLECDRQFVEKRLGQFELVAEAEVIEAGGMYITDYIADAILLAQPQRYISYEDILGEFMPSTACYGYINGILKTDYKVRFRGVIETLHNTTGDRLKEYMLGEDYREFYEYTTYYLAIGYSFDEDFGKAILEQDSINLGMATANATVYCNGVAYVDTTAYVYGASGLNGGTLTGNECSFNYVKYNEMFGTSYNKNNLKDFTPHSVTVDFYRTYDVARTTKIASIEVYIKELRTMKGLMYVSDEMFKQFLDGNYFCYGLYFDNLTDAMIISEVGEEISYEAKSYATVGLMTMTRAVEAFVPLFKLIAVILCVGVVLILVNFSISMIKAKYHDIGILKAIGTSNTSVNTVFGLQTILLAIGTAILSTLGYYLFVGLANDILITSLNAMVSSNFIMDLDLLTFQKSIAIVDIIMIFLLTIVSLLVPLLKIRTIKPVKIIKVKE